MSAGHHAKVTVWSVLWVGWALFFAVVEGLAIRDKSKGDTLSENTRAWFHTTTPVGRVVWIVLFGIFAAWFGPHIAHL